MINERKGLFLSKRNRVKDRQAERNMTREREAKQEQCWG